MKMIGTLALSMVLLHGMLVPVWAQSAVLSTPPASDVKLRSAMTSQFQALQTRLANGKTMLQAIIACHEGATKQFYVQRNATAVPGCFDPVSALLTPPVVALPVVTPPVVTPPVVTYSILQAGSWSLSCKNQRMVGSVLYADCKTYNPKVSLPTTLDLAGCGGREVHNFNGSLWCG
jgi:hypothetical protein